jgi:hypothetical protein
MDPEHTGGSRPVRRSDHIEINILDAVHAALFCTAACRTQDGAGFGGCQRKDPTGEAYGIPEPLRRIARDDPADPPAIGVVSGASGALPLQLHWSCG